jgi:DNA sulfur modification protein DndD
MFFDRIVLFNMFSYKGEQTFDLSRNSTDADKPIVLIHGDNGNGKTSLLRCMKLLFCGVSDSLRAEVRPGGKLSQSNFVHGDSAEWDGILNRGARDNRCFVSVVWHDDHQQITVTRKWDFNQPLNAQAVHGELTISIKKVEGDKTDFMEGDRAKRYLDSILPSAFVPFFFFDGEQIAVLAQERSKEESKKIESLLKIAPIESLGKALEKIKSKLRTQAFDQNTSRKLGDVNARLKTLDEVF